MKKPPFPDPETRPVNVMDDAETLKQQSARDHSDVLGSYTGTPADGEIPEQDADDL